MVKFKILTIILKVFSTKSNEYVRPNLDHITKTPCSDCNNNNPRVIYRICDRLTPKGYVNRDGSSHDSCDDCNPDDFFTKEAIEWSKKNKVPFQIIEWDVRCGNCWKLGG